MFTLGGLPQCGLGLPSGLSPQGPADPRMPTGRGAVSQGDPTTQRGSGSRCPPGLQQLHSGSPDNCCQQQECVMESVPRAPGETQDPPGGPGPAGQDLRRRVFYQRSRRPCAWCGAGVQRTGDCTARARWSQAGTKVSVTRAPVAGERHVWLGQNSAVSVPVAETRVHMGSGPAAGTHGCVVTAPTMPCARQVLSLTVAAMAARGCCLQEGEKRGALSTSGLQTHPLSPPRCPRAGDGHGLGPESSCSPCPCQRFPWRDCTLPATPS